MIYSKQQRQVYSKLCTNAAPNYLKVLFILGVNTFFGSETEMSVRGILDEIEIAGEFQDCMDRSQVQGILNQDVSMERNGISLNDSYYHTAWDTTTRLFYNSNTLSDPYYKLTNDGVAAFKHHFQQSESTYYIQPEIKKAKKKSPPKASKAVVEAVKRLNREEDKKLDAAIDTLVEQYIENSSDEHWRIAIFNDDGTVDVSGVKLLAQIIKLVLA